MKFHPSAVEEVLSSLDGVADCAVSAVPDARLGQVPVVLVVPAAGADPVAVRSTVLARALTDLPRERRPVRIVLVDELPRDPYGKLRRRLLPPLAGSG